MNWYKTSRMRPERMQEFIEKSHKSEQMVMTILEFTGNDTVQLVNEENTRGGIISPSTKIPGWWQVTDFGANGFSGDSAYKTKKEAITYCLHEGYTEQKDLITEFNKQPEFRKGNDFTRVIQYINNLGGSGGGEVLDAWEEGGLASAKQKYIEILNKKQSLEKNNNELV